MKNGIKMENQSEVGALLIYEERYLSRARVFITGTCVYDLVATRRSK